MGDAVSKDLLKWYDANQRRLPWRMPSADIKKGAKPDPYRVWLAEIMLQQTTVVMVKPYFEKFVKLWPTVEKLARAKLDDVLAAWAGLGYYSRARNLHACANQVVALGGFPQTYEELLKLKGVGSYTAAAIASIAFNEPAVVVDGNVIRVMARLHAVKTPLPQARKKIDELAAEHTPQKRPGDYAQALMDLGATICTPRSPKCTQCPLNKICVAYAKGTPEAYPVKAAKKAVPQRYATAYVLTSKDGYVLLRRREEKGLLGGMAEVPSSAWHDAAEVLDKPALPRATWRDKGGIQHVFTHFRFDVTVRHAELAARAALPAPYFWVKVKDIGKQALPTVMKKILQRAEIA